MEDSTEEEVKTVEATKKSPENKVDLLKDIKCSSGSSSDTSDLIEVDKDDMTIGPLGREPSVSVSEKEVRGEGGEEESCLGDNCGDNLPVQSDVLEDRGTGYNFGKRWSYFNGEIFSSIMEVS